MVRPLFEIDKETFQFNAEYDAFCRAHNITPARAYQMRNVWHYKKYHTAAILWQKLLINIFVTHFSYSFTLPNNWRHFNTGCVKYVFNGLKSVKKVLIEWYNAAMAWKHFPHFWAFVRGTTGHKTVFIAGNLSKLLYKQSSWRLLRRNVSADFDPKSTFVQQHQLHILSHLADGVRCVAHS